MGGAPSPEPLVSMQIKSVLEEHQEVGVCLNRMDSGRPGESQVTGEVAGHWGHRCRGLPATPGPGNPALSPT